LVLMFGTLHQDFPLDKGIGSTGYWPIFSVDFQYKHA